MYSVSTYKLTKSYPGTQSGLLDFCLEVNSGEHFVVAGPSGSGKTTLLRLIAGLESPDRGRVLFNGRDVTASPPRDRNVALVAQRPAIYPHLTVRGNLRASVDLQRRPIVGDMDRRVTEAAEVLQLTAILERRADRLSGGEQQRVAIGRAWVGQAGIWLLDEPFAHLDSTNRIAIRAELHLLRERSGATMIEVTHDPSDALTLGRRVAVLRAGRLDQVGLATELYARPASRTVAAAIGLPAMNFADGVVLGFDGHPAMQFGQGVTVPLPAAAAAQVGSGAVVSLGIRPEWIAPGRDGWPLGDWRVVRGVPFGPGWLAVIERPGVTWQAWLPREPDGATVALETRVEHLLLFDQTGRRVWPAIDDSGIERRGSSDERK